MSLDLEGATIPDTLTAYRKLTGAELGVRTEVASSLSCVRISIHVRGDTVAEIDRGLEEVLADKGIAIRERAGLRVLARDYAKPAPCPNDRPVPTTSSLPSPIDPDPSSEDLVSRVQRLSDGHYRIARSVLDAIGPRVVRMMRVVPFLADGGVSGLKLYGIRPASVAAALGLENGDLVVALDGRDVTKPEQVLELYARRKTLDSFTIDLVRGGKPVTITVDVVPDVPMSLPSALASPMSAPPRRP